jgi:organic radical activating enzyme
MTLKTIKLKLDRLDLTVAYTCNIQCLGCISLSDFPRRGVASVDEITQWLEYWSQHLDIDVITLFGGEPLIHPDIIKICQQIRKYYPTSVIRLITNGYLLDRVEPNAWFDFQPFEIQISVHRLDHESTINNQIKKILTVKSGWQTRVAGLNQHQQIQFAIDEFKIYKSKFKDFVAPYKLVDQKLLPFDSDPTKAHSICGSPNTPVLYKGKLYKCPPVANLIDLTGENWNNYQCCETWEELPNFIAQVGKPEKVCAQCPETQSQHSYDHFNINNVKIKQKSLS